MGAYGLRNNIFDMWLMAIFGIVGYLMRRYNLPIPPMILGLILGPLAEDYFLTSVTSSGEDPLVFFTRPISGILMVISLFIFFWLFIRPLLKGR